MTWWRRNRWYLVAVAVLVPVAAIVTLNAGYFAYVADAEGEPIAVDGAETVEYAGAQWSLLEWYSFDADSDAGASAGLLPGTTLITATVGVRPDPGLAEGEAPGCTFQLEDASGDRTWSTASSDESDFVHRDGTQETCSTDATEDYRVQVHFIVPDDAADGARLRLFDANLLPSLLLFEL